MSTVGSAADIKIDMRIKGVSVMGHTAPEVTPWLGQGLLEQGCGAPNEALARFASATTPVLKAAARGHLELQGLANRRMQAWIEVPGKAMACRSPNDVVNAQTQFWQTAYRQYAESAKRIAEAWSPLMAAMMLPGGSFWAQQTAKLDESARDLITFPESSPSTAAAAAPGKRQERRAA